MKPRTITITELGNGNWMAEIMCPHMGGRVLRGCSDSPQCALSCLLYSLAFSEKESKSADAERGETPNGGAEKGLDDEWIE